MQPSANLNVEEKKRYNEKQVIKEFLNSPLGLNNLLEKVRNYDKNKIYETGTNQSKLTLQECVDELIDFYVAWLNNCPSKIVFNKSHYEGFKHLERICDDKEVKALFSYLLNWIKYDIATMLSNVTYNGYKNTLFCL